MDKVEVVLVDERLKGLLSYATNQSAGIDMRASSVSLRGSAFARLDEGVSYTICPGEQCKVGTGIKMHIGSLLSDEDWAMANGGMTLAGLLLPRSGLGTKYRIRLSNTVGLIDADYQGEVIMVLENNGSDPWVFKGLERMAQLVIVPVMRVGFNVVPGFSGGTERGEGGFGSTGNH